MPSAVRLREDYSAKELRALARRSKDVNQRRRLLSLAAVRDGMDRGGAAKIGGMDRQTLRDWVHRFNASGPQGLIDNWTEGPKPRLSEQQLTQFAQIVEAGPDRGEDGVVRWRRIDLKRVIAERFGVAFHERYVGKLLKKLGFSHISARPRHPAQDERIVEGFKRTSRAARRPISKGCRRRRRSRYGLRTRPGSARRTGRFGSGPSAERRPRQPADQRYDNAYLFGAICPARGVGGALALPYADADMMQLHLDEISRNVADGAHAVLILDRAGWHTTGKLDVPDNITPIFLPSRAPELNPVENVWQYLRQNWLSNTVFENYDAIIDAACAAWRNLIAQPETITSIGMRDWAHIGQTL